MVRGRFLVFLVTCTTLLPSGHIDQAVAIERRQHSEVILLGSVKHRHLQSQGYSPESLREIAVACKPDVILVELPANADDTIASVTVQSVRRIPSLSPEIHIAAEVAKRLGAELVCFGVPEREESLRKMKYYDERRYRANQGTREWMDWLARQKSPDKLDLGMIKLACHLEKSLSFYDSPRTVNFAGFDAVVRDKYFLYYELIPYILKKYDSFRSVAMDWEFLASEWARRNLIMAKNIGKIAREYAGKRILVIIGAEHRYILRDLLERQEEVTLKEYWEIKPTAAEATHTAYEHGGAGIEKSGMPSKIVGGSTMWRQKYKKTVELSVPSIPGGRFTLKNFNGSVNVKAGVHEKFSIEASIAAKAATEERAKELVEGTRIESKSEPGGVAVKVVRPHTVQDENLTVHFEIVAPSQTDLEVTTSNGDIVVWGIVGKQRCRTYNGSIKCHHVSSWTELVTCNGNISLTCSEELSGKCHVKATTSNGSIDFSGMEGLSIVVEAQTSNGTVLCKSPVTVEEISRTELRGRTGRGEGHVFLETSNGNITIR